MTEKKGLTPSEVIAHWDKDAQNWQLSEHPILKIYEGSDYKYFNLRRERILQRLKKLTPLRGELGLDLASGPGSAPFFDHQVNTTHIVSADISPQMLHLNPNPLKVQLDATEQFPLPASIFDWAVVLFLMKYLTLEGQLHVLTEVERTLKPGAWAIFLDHQRIRQSTQAIFTPEALLNNYPGQAKLTLETVLEDNYSLGYGSPLGRMPDQYYGHLYLLLMHKPAT
jgi:ubiquinone/menaquinone biosynthesis C-methylase UbiE